MVNKNISFAAAFLAAALLLINVATAIPVPFHQFYGSATSEGTAVAGGLTLEAKINGVTYGSCITAADGSYGFEPSLLKVKADDGTTVEVEGGTNGDVVEFYLGSTKAAETFIFADSTLTELDLTFATALCTESWTCTAWSDWSTCSSSTQSKTRTCTDANSCGTTVSKPAETDSQACSSGTGGTGGGGGGGGGGRGDAQSTTCTSKDFICCDKCADGTAQTTYDKTCTNKVCCSKCYVETTTGGEPITGDVVSKEDGADGTGITGASILDTMTRPGAIAGTAGVIILGLGVALYFKYFRIRKL